MATLTYHSARSREAHATNQFRSVSFRARDLYLLHVARYQRRSSLFEWASKLPQCIISSKGEGWASSYAGDILDADVEPFNSLASGSIWESSRTWKSSSVPRNCRRALSISQPLPSPSLFRLGSVERNEAEETRRNSKKNGRGRGSSLPRWVTTLRGRTQERAKW